jgi:rhodanese-related sulfurtransferase
MNIEINEELTSDELVDLLKSRNENKIDFLLVDVRESFELEESKIVGMDIHLPTSSFDISKIEKYKDKNIVVYCRSGARTTQVKAYLKNYGFSKVSHLTNGISMYFGDTE